MADPIMSKKGTTFGAYILMIFLTVVLVLIPFNGGIQVLVAKAIAYNADSHNLEHYILFHRVMESPNSIFYTDPVLQRTYPSRVDISKFNEETLEKLMDKGSKTSISFKLTLKTPEDTKEIFYNKNLYEIIEPTHATRPAFLSEINDPMHYKRSKFQLIQTSYPVTAVYPSGREIPGILIVSAGFERTA